MQREATSPPPYSPYCKYETRRSADGPCFELYSNNETVGDEIKKGGAMYKNGYYMAQGVFVMILVLLSMTAAGCDVIGGIFKAGMWTAVILIIVVVGLITLLVRLFKGRG
jgi:hypothetical protein